MADQNYLIGRGELLVEPLSPPKRRVDKAHPYSIGEAQARLAPQLRNVIEHFPTESFLAPDGVQVAKFALHPSYLAKSFHPDALVRAAGLEIVGSHATSISVEKHTKTTGTHAEHDTSELYVAGGRAAFDDLYSVLSSAAEAPTPFSDIRQFEAITSFSVDDKIRSIGGGQEDVYELVLHLPSTDLAPDNQAAFVEAAEASGVDLLVDRAFETGSLWFVPARGSGDAVRRLARYTTLRVARLMPRIRLDPLLEGDTSNQQLVLPVQRRRRGAVRAAVLDGGIPEDHPIGAYLESYRPANPKAKDVADYTAHGVAVTSALLFGSIRTSSPDLVDARVSHIRVLDDTVAEDDPLELYSVLAHVDEVLLSRAYDFINLSLGPDLPIEDDDVHAWTSVIDDRLSDGETFLTVAAGNNGELDRDSGNARVQVPGDAVNALSVGASDSESSVWRRAPYSALGPGRRPGHVKPDLVAFGGSPSEPFIVLDDRGTGTIGVNGTSFASPLALRNAVTIRSLLGSDLSPLAVRALLLHAAEPLDHPTEEVGWGALPPTTSMIVTSGDGIARIIYQGEVAPGKYIRAKVPIPSGGLDGMVAIRATFCFSTPVDTAAPDVYTRAGLEPVFRPDIHHYDDGANTPRSRTFFARPHYDGEDVQRAEFGKWEPVLRASHNMRGNTLRDPAFDIHYNAREVGGKSRTAEPLKYALVITLEARRHPQLHQSILDSYPGILVSLEPGITLELDA